MKASSASIPLGDAVAFDRRARMVRRVRLVVIALVLGGAALCLAVSLRLSATSTSLLPRSSSGVVVLDVSASISSDTYARIAATLQRLVRSNGSYGLVLFSDTAYQALPPNTPARELRPIERFFDVARQQGTGALAETPRSPWTDAFGAGTRISTGLSLALDVIRANRLSNPAVLLVSDLDDDTGDLERVSQVAIAYRRAGIPLHVVGLNAAPEDEAFIRRLVPGKGSFTEARLPSEGSRFVSGSTDLLLVAAAVLVALGLAALLLVTEPMRWSSTS
jgi:hypothetical protein